MLFLDNTAPDSCCAEHPLHIPTCPRLVSTAAKVREKTCRQTYKPTARLLIDGQKGFKRAKLRVRKIILDTSLFIGCQEQEVFVEYYG